MVVPPLDESDPFVQAWSSFLNVPTPTASSSQHAPLYDLADLPSGSSSSLSAVDTTAPLSTDYFIGWPPLDEVEAPFAAPYPASTTSSHQRALSSSRSVDSNSSIAQLPVLLDASLSHTGPAIFEPPSTFTQPFSHQNPSPQQKDVKVRYDHVAFKVPQYKRSNNAQHSATRVVAPPSSRARGTFRHYSMPDPGKYYVKLHVNYVPRLIISNTRRGRTYYYLFGDKRRYAGYLVTSASA